MQLHRESVENLHKTVDANVKVRLDGVGCGFAMSKKPVVVVNRPLPHKLLTSNNYVKCPSNFAVALSICLFHPPFLRNSFEIGYEVKFSKCVVILRVYVLLLQAMYLFMAKFEELNKNVGPLQEIAAQMYPSIKYLQISQFQAYSGTGLRKFGMPQVVYTVRSTPTERSVALSFAIHTPRLNQYLAFPTSELEIPSILYRIAWRLIVRDNYCCSKYMCM